MYDIIFVGQKNKRWYSLKNNYPTAKYAEDFYEAQKMCVTNFFWLVWDNLEIRESFVFDYVPDDWSQNFLHTFLNDDSYDGGIALVPKKAEPLQKEIQHRFFIKDVKQVEIEASKNATYDRFYIDSYEEYCAALQNSSTELFWGISRNLKLLEDFNLEFTFKYTNEYDRKTNHAFIHRVDDKDYYNGVFLLSKHAEVTQRELDHRFLVARKEWDIVASGPVKYDVFDIQSYQDYQTALEISTTEMFWGKLRSMNVIDESIFDIYFNFDNEYDRHQNHAFLHDVNGEQKYDGLYLFSKHVPVTAKEIDHKFLVARKEWDVVASSYKPYDQFYIDSYEEYEYALQNSSTELFWGISRNLKIADDFDLGMFFDDRTNEFEHDRSTNHAFIHRVDDKDYYNGLFLFSTKAPVTAKEINHRFLVASKEWNIVASGPVQYDKFVVSSYEDYEIAFTKSKTEMFWIIPSYVDISKTFEFNFYFTHDNEFDRKINHVFKNGQYYDGIILCSKHSIISEKEFKYRFIANKKEQDIIASYPKSYDAVTVDSYEDFVEQRKNVSTDFFYVIPTDVDICWDFEYHIPYYDRDNIHVFKNGNYHDGVFLIHKDRPLSQREFYYRFFVNKKEIDIHASNPKPYDIVFISYNEPNADENYAALVERFPRAKRIHGVKGIHQAHIAAAKLCSTPMFWVVDGDARIVDDFNFDYQVPGWQYDNVHVWRSQNPINDLVYGYGGIKLFPRELTIKMDTSKPDMTTSISEKFKAMPSISNITAFNTDPFNTWKSAFRECVKLSSKIIDRQKDDETNKRLKTWTTVGEDRQYGKYAIQGALDGSRYGRENRDNLNDLKKINDFDWLKEKFNGNI